MFEPKSKARERILLYGDPGSGKTYSYLSIARILQATGSPARMHILDTDMAAERMLEVEFADLENVEVYPAYDWLDYVRILGEIKGRITPDDWIAVDLICKAWLAAQEYYVDRVYSQGMDQFFLDARIKIEESARAKAKASPLDGWKDWTVINRIYNAWSEALLMKTNCHVIACAKSAATSTETDTRQTLATFGSLSAKPCGQKHLPYNFHTVIMASSFRDRYVMSTAKDRGRSHMEGPVENFPIDYLISIAGWSMG